MEQSPEGGLRELEARLARSRAAWKLVVGHHPIRWAGRWAGSWPGGFGTGTYLQRDL